MKNITQIVGKTFVVPIFFTDQVNHKTVNKTICNTPSPYPG